MVGRVLHLEECLLPLNVLGDLFEFTSLQLQGTLKYCQLITLLLLILIGKGELIKKIETKDPALALLQDLQTVVHGLVHLVSRILLVLRCAQHLILS